MKKYIKFIALLVLSISLLAASGCTSTAATTIGGAYFLSNPSELGIGNVNEVVNYKVEFKNNTASTNTYDITVNLDEGLYTQKLSNAIYTKADGTKVACYLLETELVTVLSFNMNGTTTETYNDVVSTLCYFSGVNDKLAPIYSEETSSAHTPYVDKKGNKTVIEYDYTLKTTYNGEDAVVDFNGIKGNYDLENGEKLYEDYYDSTYYFDNEMMLFMPRAIKLTDSSSLSFDCIDGLSGKIRSMQLASDTTTPTESLIFDPASEKDGVIKHVYSLNGHKGVYKNSEGQQVIPCQVVNFSISGTFSGSPIKCWYAQSTLEGENCRLIKMEVSAPYSIGTFIYSITDTTAK